MCVGDPMLKRTVEQMKAQALHAARRAAWLLARLTSQVRALSVTYCRAMVLICLRFVCVLCVYVCVCA